MSIHLINKYYSEVEKIKRFGGSSKETAIRNAFYQLLNDYAKQKDLFLIPELDYRTSAGKTVRPDGIPPANWEYKLGNRSDLEWILDQYKEKKPSDPTIAEKFNTYRFADYKEKVIDLLMRVCTVSVETVKVVGEMGGELI